MNDNDSHLTDTDPVVETQTLRLDLPAGGLRLEHGGVLPRVDVAYETYGTLSAARDNAIYICHALTGDAHVAGRYSGESAPSGWWHAMVGPGRGIDTRYYFVICANILGGCKGTTGPGSVNPATGAPYGSQFPAITVGDIVEVQHRLVRQLGAQRLAAVIGGSFGGMQALEWAVRFPDAVEHCICIASAASLSSMALAFDIIGRRAILEDPDWRQGDYYRHDTQPVRGLSLARKLAHVTYLSQDLMREKFGRERRETNIPRHPDVETPAARPFLTDFQVESYLEHQGRKFIARFDANAYLHISRAMDEYDLEARFGDLERAFASVKSRFLIVALSGDWLFMPEQSMQMVSALIRKRKRVSYCCLDAPHGHDAFLTQVEHLTEVLRAFLPWVGPTRPAASPASVNPEHERLIDAIVPGSRVLDLGCGDGTLLSLLQTRRGIHGTGVEIDLAEIIQALNAGHDVLQADVDRGLSMFPDNACDVVLLSETLQVMMRPRFVLHEILRVAREALVAFPNFGHWLTRWKLFWEGRMPKADPLPYEWFDTPNIHLFTLRDVVALCRHDDITVRGVTCLPGRRLLSRLLVGLGRCNIGAERVVVHLARKDNDGNMA